jgi:formylglycine-generating enzyme required for sulfatase activity
VLAELLAPLLSKWRDEIERSKGPKERLLTNSIRMELTLIPSGTFFMGSPEAEVGRQNCEGPRRGVTISRPFYLGIYPVTQRQYDAVMGCNPSLFAGNPDHPVERVGWEDAVEFCTQLAALPSENEAGRVYRLPTEAEWEFACRGGTVTLFHFGAAASFKQANFDGKHPYGGAPKGPYLQRTSKVGSYDPNGWGLYDMHGNVREWCADWFAGDYYGKRENSDPQGPQTGDLRVLRGGSWGSKGRNCRAAYREGSSPGSRNNAGFGFRVVCAVAAGSQQLIR